MRVRLLGQEFLRIVSPVCTQRDFRRDLENHKVDFVAMCPTYTVDEFEASNPGYKNKGAWESVRRGRTEGLHLLGSRGDPENNRGCLVIDFGQIFSLPPGYLEKKAGDSGGRWRLDSPFLEHFSQAFARYFMRVGDARAANCFVHDALTGNFLEYRFTGSGPNWAQAYAGHYHSFDLARGVLLAQPAGRMYPIHHYVPDSAVQRSEYYQDFYMREGLRYSCGGTLLEGGECLILAVHCPVGHRPHEEAIVGELRAARIGYIMRPKPTINEREKAPRP